MKTVVYGPWCAMIQWISHHQIGDRASIRLGGSLHKALRIRAFHVLDLGKLRSGYAEPSRGLLLIEPEMLAPFFQEVAAELATLMLD